ncbi:DNA polymerase alpha-associated DNA helicase A [Cyphellophora attinorum]|uniref:DNA helicase n=1 Tax=Cyphellophora attinorum TaxID=1664694 RepID=A0A0N1H8F0_9EURO|nr:DNA polymerase alpha-associated DNA helicase A [Phialophora attinorum]KPI43155.1 DNA polymerase alpha-associated DNA helicase A [Phialophora attinorum]
MPESQERPEPAEISPKAESTSNETTLPTRTKPKPNLKSSRPSKPPKSSTPIPPAAYIHTLLSLLNLELAVELSQTTLLLSSTPPAVLARAGLALLNLCITATRTGLGGRTVLSLGLDPATADASAEGRLPEHGIGVGDVVRLAERVKEGGRRKGGKDGKGEEKEGVEGVVVKTGERKVEVALGKRGGKDDDGDSGVDGLGDGRLWLVKLANDIPNRRMTQTLTTLLKTPPESYTPLQRILFGLETPTPPDLNSPEAKNITFHNPNLNPSQKAAIQFALAAPDIALIHGPPGTGKTYTLIELILQYLDQGKRVLVCGPSNISVDNIVERLTATSPKTNVVRVGHPARLLPSVLGRSLEVLSDQSEQRGLVKDVGKEIEERVKEVRSGKIKGKGERGKVWGEVRELRREYREREGRVVREVVQGCGVVVSTLHGAGGRDVGGAAGGKKFDVVVVDEAAQAVEPQCWIPVVMAGEVSKLVLAGDHLQLPPTIKGKDGEIDKAEEKKRIKALEEELRKLAIEDAVVKKCKSWSLETTMFDRLLSLYGNDIKRLLNVQYRMHERIMRFPSDELYDGELQAATGVEARLLRDLEYDVEDTEDTREPLVFYDTQGGDFPEKTEDGATDGKAKKSVLLGDSKSNEMEAAVVKMHVQNLIAAGIGDEDIAVITPYNAQLAVISGMLRETYPGIEMGSVDGFQGREKEAVIVSLVRSNPEHEVGFLGEKRRLNGEHALKRREAGEQQLTFMLVAMTRPRRHLCVIGDSETVSRGSPFLKRWMKHLEDNADLRYPSLDELELS